MVAVVVALGITGGVLWWMRGDERTAAAEAWYRTGIPWAAHDTTAYCLAAYAIGPGMVYSSLDECRSEADQLLRLTSDADVKLTAASRVDPAKMRLLPDKSVIFWGSAVSYPDGPPRFDGLEPLSPLRMLTVMQNIDGQGWRIVGQKLDGTTMGYVPAGRPDEAPS
ncbi:MAG: hypothetical protein HY241_13165 [Actinobacteria bacterium]|nr:hypothetical protein [Actinomycetota bacterium]